MEKIYDDIVDEWDIEVVMSVVADIHVSLEAGKEYLKSTYQFNDRKLHGSFFAFDNDINSIENKLPKNISNNLLDMTHERQLKGVPYRS